MKKRFFVVLIMMFCVVMILSACSLFAGQDSNSNNIEGDNVFAAQSGLVLNERYSTVRHSASTEADLIDSYYDDSYYYYYFYLGKVNDVPLQSTTEVPYYHYTGNNFTKAFKTTTTTTQSVEESCTTAVTNTTTFSSTKNIDIGLNVKVATSTEAKISAGSFASASVEKTFEFGASIEAGYSRTTGKSDSTSRTNSYKQVATSSETTEETTGFGFTNESRIGYYRYIMTGSVDVYTVVVYSREEEIFYLKTLTEVMSFGYSFDYSESSRFDDNQCGSLEFDCSILNDLLSHIPEKSLSEKEGDVTPPQTGGDTTNYAGGYGTTASPYLIANATHLKNIDRNKSANFKLIEDITLSGEWTPISTFIGTLDGAGHTITGLNITSYNERTGFIRTLNGTVSNLIFENVNVRINNTSSGNKTCMLGVVCGVNSGTVAKVQIIDSNIAIDKLGSTDHANKYITHVGFIAGYNYSDINNCKVYSSTALGNSHAGDGAARSYVGGIAGTSESGSQITHCDIYNCQQIKANACGAKHESIFNWWVTQCDAYAGGIVGYAVSATISDCHIYGTAVGTNIIGYAHDSASDCMRSANGLICGLNSGSTITNCSQ